MGINRVSMIKFQCFLICLISMVAWADDIRQDRVNNFLYGPYLNDRPIVYPKPYHSYWVKNGVKKANLNKLKSQFYTWNLLKNATIAP